MQGVLQDGVLQDDPRSLLRMAFIISLIIQAKHNHILFILGAVVWYTSLFFFVLGACTPLAAVAQGKGWAKNGGVSLTADSLKAAHGSVPHFEHGRGHFGRCVALAGPWRYRAGDDPSRADPQYIVKPFSTPELLARVDRVMQTRRMLQEHFRKELKVEPAAGCRPSPRPISGVWPSPPPARERGSAGPRDRGAHRRRGRGARRPYNGSELRQRRLDLWTGARGGLWHHLRSPRRVCRTGHGSGPGKPHGVPLRAWEAATLRRAGRPCKKEYFLLLRAACISTPEKP